MEQFQASQRQELEFASRRLSEQQAEIENAARTQQEQQVQANHFADQMSIGMNRQFADMRSELQQHLAEQTAPPVEVRRKTRTIAEPTVGRYVQESAPQPQIGWQPSLAATQPQVVVSSAASTSSWDVPERPIETMTHYQISTPAIENEVDDTSDLDEPLLVIGQQTQ